MLITPDKIKLILSLIAVFLIPGWSFIAITGLWRLWRPLQRWIVAIGASLAFYPILFYSVRFILPSFRLGFNKNLFMLIVGLIITILALRKNWQEQFNFDRWEVFSIAAISATIFTRFWLIRDLPYPAWTDSLHHTLLTKLVAESGSLPYTLEPYSGSSLDMYHLGLYAITGVIQQLSGVPAHTALLWTAQLLNGLCAIGVYFVLDRFVSRQAAFTGVVVAGLLSFQPAWYVNWGRFTQLASQTVMLVAFGITWELIRSRNEQEPNFSRSQLLWVILLASGLNAAIFLLHFRVAGYYLPLIILLILFELRLSISFRRVKSFILSLLAVGVLSLLFIMSAIVPAIKFYLSMAAQAGSASASDAYFGYSKETIFGVGVHPWLFWISVIAGIIALVSRNRRLAGMTWLWIILLFIEGNLYRIGISSLNFTNFSGITIGFYLPAALLTGTGIEALANILPLSWQDRFRNGLVFALFAMGFVASFYRATGIEQWRFFMTEQDRQAMDWIKENTPIDSVFAINTSLWMTDYPIGTDGGYWIPYFTGRQTNAGTMLFGSDRVEQVKIIQKRSIIIVDYISGRDKIPSLCDEGLDYIYIGKGNVISKGFDINNLFQEYQTKLAYQNPGVLIFQLCP